MFGCTAGFGLLRLGAVEANVDDDIAVLPEHAHFRRAIERKNDSDGIEFDLRFNRLQRRRQRGLRVRHIPIDLLIEIKSESAVSALGHDIHRARHCEHVSDEGRLVGNFNPDERRLFVLLFGLLLVQLTFGIARTPDKSVDHLLRQPRHRALPGFRQEINIKPLSRGDRIDLQFSCQRNTDCAAVGIAPRRADKFGGIDAETLNGDRDRLIEGYDYDLSGDARGCLHGLVKLKHQPHITAINDGFDFAFDRIIGAGCAKRREREQGEQRHGCEAAAARNTGRGSPRSARKHLPQLEWQSRHKAVPAGWPAGRNSVRTAV